MGGKIDVYVDCVSPFSYLAFLYLLKNRKDLESYDVDIEFHPIFLGGVMQGSGNQPPWKLPARGAYMRYDRLRAMDYFEAPNMRPPDIFPVNTLLAQRGASYIKANYSRDQFESTLRELWIGLWEQNQDLSKPEVLAPVLQRLFSEEETEAIIKAGGEEEWKQKVSQETKEALDKGAYGAPWFWVTNKDGKEEPFFGSDRFTYMWRFLGIDFEDVRIKPRM